MNTRNVMIVRMTKSGTVQVLLTNIICENDEKSSIAYAIGRTRDPETLTTTLLEKSPKESMPMIQENLSTIESLVQECSTIQAHFEPHSRLEEIKQRYQEDCTLYDYCQN